MSALSFAAGLLLLFFYLPVSMAQNAHRTFDFEMWTAKRANKEHLPSWMQDGKLTSTRIVGPYDIVDNETLRARLITDEIVKAKYPAGVFVWAVEDPQVAFATKIGGVPYRRASDPWPMVDGQPAVFLAQLCFADCNDCVKGNLLAGDVLLVFANAETHLGYETKFVTEWQTIEIDPAKLATRAHIPVQPDWIPELYGVLHKTCDYELRLTPTMESELIEQGYDLDFLTRTHGSKIGGLEPVMIAEESFGREDETFIASIGSIDWTFQQFVDSAPPATRKAAFGIGDTGCLLVFSKDGTIAVRFATPG